MKNNINKPTKIKIKLSTKPEKAIMTTALSVAGAILLDEKKKKIKNPDKYHNFFQRTKRNYKIADNLLKKTLAKDLYKKTEVYDSDVLNNLKIENGEFINLK